MYLEVKFRTRRDLWKNPMQYFFYIDGKLRPILVKLLKGIKLVCGDIQNMKKLSAMWLEIFLKEFTARDFKHAENDTLDLSPFSFLLKFKSTLENRVSQPLHYWRYRPDNSIFEEEGCPVHRRMFSSNLGLYPVDTKSNLPAPRLVTTRNVSRHCQMVPGGQNHPV